MKIYHSIEYTVPAPHYGAGTREQCSAAIIRDRCLTHNGCERILRKDRHDAVVTRVERMSYGKR